MTMERTVGNYALERPIAHGGMGTVWLAHRRDGRFEGRAAIKFLDALLGPAGVERFRREGNVLARLGHANIARLIDAGVTDDDQPYLVLEYVEGEPLDRWCESRSLDVRARVRLFLEVLAAVAHAHSKLIVHRELKPANILVRPDGQVKVLDFGTVALVDADAATTATDVHALRVVLGELLAGRQLGRDLDAILNRVYQTAEAFADDLRRYLDGEPVRARGDSTWYRTGKFLARHHIAAGAALVVIAAIVTAGGFSLRQAHEATIQRDKARALSARNGAVISFVNSMLADAAPSHGPISISELLERSYSNLTFSKQPPEHEAAVLALLAQFFANNGNSSRAETMLDRSLELTARSTDAALRAQLLCQSGAAARSMGRRDKARAEIREGAKLAGDDDLAAVTCLEAESWLAQADNDPDATLTFARRAQERLRQSGMVRPDWSAVLLARIADAHYMRGHTTDAERYYAASLWALAKIGRGESIATYAIRSRWASIAADTGDTLRALHDYEQLLQVVAKSSLSGKPPAYLVASRGSLLAQLARYPEALENLDEAIELANGSGNVVYGIVARASRADVLVSMGKPEIAARELRDLAPLIDKTIAADSTWMQRILRVRARIDAAEGRTPEALSRYSEVIAQPNVTDALLARVLAERSELYLKLGQTDLALADAQRDVQVARELQRDKPYSSYTGRALAMLARVQQARAAPDDAHASATEAALNLSKTLGDDHPDTRWARQASL
jgi:eukaryotic-like serine/threonine-protein kinase